MSYGRVYIDYAPELTADDRIGASLLRPDPAWSARVGSISGTLQMEGEPVPYSAVWAVRRDGGEARYTVGTFSDLEGRFKIEGLEAGDYTLWAHGVVVLRGILLAGRWGRPIWGTRSCPASSASALDGTSAAS